MVRKILLFILASNTVTWKDLAVSKSSLIDNPAICIWRFLVLTHTNQWVYNQVQNARHLQLFILSL